MELKFKQMTRKFKNLEIGQLFRISKKKNELEYVKQTKYHCRPTGFLSSNLIEIDSDKKCIIYYELKEEI